MDIPAEHPVESSLRAEFEAEVSRLAANAASLNPVESVMRIRALREIADLLTTGALLNLAHDLAEGGSPDGGGGVAFRYRQHGRA